MELFSHAAPGVAIKTHVSRLDIGAYQRRDPDAIRVFFFGGGDVKDNEDKGNNGSSVSHRPLRFQLYGLKTQHAQTLSWSTLSENAGHRTKDPTLPHSLPLR